MQAVVQEQGLMNEYKRLRRSAIQSTEALKQKHHQPESRNPPTPESKHGFRLMIIISNSAKRIKPHENL